MRLTRFSLSALAVLVLAWGACHPAGAPEPRSLSWDIRIAGPEEPGEPLVITGTIFLADGKTPAEGAILYAYHADKDGVYPGRGRGEGLVGRHGRLHAWLRTGKDGRYRITTIRPGSYPRSRIPQHIHATVTPPGGEERSIPDFHFADDPFVSESMKERAKQRGRGNILELTRDENGVWRGSRDIVLPR